MSVSISLVLAELIVANLFPQNLSGSWRIQHDSGVMLNKDHGIAHHRFDKRDITYTFGEFHQRKLKAQPLGSTHEKVLILGDSFTFGWLLDDEFTYVNGLQKHYKNKLFINAAAGGWGTADQTKYVELFCQKISPREVWVFLNIEDIERSWNSNLYKLDLRDELTVGSPTRVSYLKKHLNALPLYQWFLEHSHLVQLLRNVYLGQSRGANKAAASQGEVPPNTVTAGITEAKVNKVHVLATQLFLKLARDVKTCNANLKIIYTGWSPIFGVADSEPGPTMLFLRFSKDTKFFEKIGAEFYDLSAFEPMKKVHLDKAAYSIPIDIHPNELGAASILESTLIALR